MVSPIFKEQTKPHPKLQIKTLFFITYIFYDVRKEFAKGY
jgi:hypothetical protein